MDWTSIPLQCDAPTRFPEAAKGKHVVGNIRRFDQLYDRAVAAEATTYSSKRRCNKACRALIKYMDKLFSEAEDYVHDTNPHPY